MTEPLLTRRRMLDALGRLGDHLAADRIVGEIFLIGGAVMVMEHDARAGTVDLDAVDYEPHGAIERAARQVAEEMGLPRSWLNQQASAYAPAEADWRRSEVFDHPALRLYAIAPRQLLAMKIVAGRLRDADDIRILCDRLGITDPDEALALTREVFPQDDLPAYKADLVRDVLRR